MSVVNVVRGQVEICDELTACPEESYRVPVYVCVCVCVFEREREREREKGGQQ